MSDVKYVVVEQGLSTDLVIFPATMSHSDFKGVGRIISAGYIRRHHEKKCGFYPYGESVTLNLKARPEDQFFLDQLLGDKDEW